MILNTKPTDLVGSLGPAKVEKKPASGGVNAVKGFLAELEQNWDQVGDTQKVQVDGVSDKFRGLLKTQIAIGRLELQSQIAIKAGEAVSGTVKKLESLAG